MLMALLNTEFKSLMSGKKCRPNLNPLGTPHLSYMNYKEEPNINKNYCQLNKTL